MSDYVIQRFPRIFSMKKENDSRISLRYKEVIVVKVTSSNDSDTSSLKKLIKSLKMEFYTDSTYFG